MAEKGKQMYEDKISVIVAAYQCEKYLSACIDSIVQQTHKNLEIIIIDDGSTDNTGRIAELYKEKDKRILVVHQENQGVSAARNAGILKATGTYLSFVDSDDTIDPDMYEFLLDKAKSHNALVTHCGYRRIEGNITQDINGTGVHLLQSGNEAISCMLQGVYFCGALWNKLYDRKLLDGLYFDTKLKINEDILFNVKAFQKTDRIYFEDVPKYNYFVREHSACADTPDEKKQLDGIAAARQIAIILDDTDISDVGYSRLAQTLIQRSRCLLNYRNCKEERKRINGEIKNSLSNIKSKSFRIRINAFLICNASTLYRFVYCIYNKIRKPNWDAKTK